MASALGHISPVRAWDARRESASEIRPAVMPSRPVHTRIERRGTRQSERNPAMSTSTATNSVNRSHRIHVVLRHRVDEILAHPMPAEDFFGEGRADEEEARNS